MAGAGRVRRSRRLREAPHLRAARAAGVAPEEWRDWAGGLPDEVLAKVAGMLVAQNEAGWAPRLKERDPVYWTEEEIQEEMERRKREGNCLYVFARVCKPWRKAQLKNGGPLRTRVESDVILPGQVALVKWALSEGCPRERGDADDYNMAEAAASFGHTELVRWLIQEQGFAMDRKVMGMAAHGGNIELVRWLRGEGCPWNYWTCYYAVGNGRVEVLRWARENGCEWDAETRDRAAAELGYTDDFGNLVEVDEHWDEDPSGYSDMSDEYSDDD